MLFQTILSSLFSLQSERFGDGDDQVSNPLPLPKYTLWRFQVLLDSERVGLRVQSIQYSLVVREPLHPEELRMILNVHA